MYGREAKIKFLTENFRNIKCFGTGYIAFLLSGNQFLHPKSLYDLSHFLLVCHQHF